MPALFNPSVSGWQYTSYAFTLSDGTSAVKRLLKLGASGLFNQVNKGYFDGIQLITMWQTAIPMTATATLFPLPPMHSRSQKWNTPIRI